MDKQSTCCNASPDSFDKCAECHDECEFYDADEASEMAVNRLIAKMPVYAAIVFVCGMVTGSVATAMYAADLISGGQR